MKNKIICIITGTIVGVSLTATVFWGYSKIAHNEEVYSGGWVLEKEENVEGKQPISFDFRSKYNTVDIKTADGSTCSCKYSVSESETGSDILKIFNYPGIGDIVFDYVSLQPILILKGSGTYLDGDYRFAG